MPGPWLTSRHSPWEEVLGLLEEGALLEVVPRDPQFQEQGTLIVAVGSVSLGTPRGRGFDGTVIAASDPYLQWWLDDQDLFRKVVPFHWCKGAPEQCRFKAHDEGFST